MRRLHRTPVLMAGLLLALGLVACRQEGETRSFHPDRYLFGNGFKDTSPVAARVGDETITERDIELHYKELPAAVKKRFTGPGWRRLLLHDMVREALLAQAAHRAGITNDPEVRQRLISAYRATLVGAYKDKALYEKLQPSEDDIVAYYKQHRDELVTPTYVKVRHIQCSTKEKAEEAYAKAKANPRRFPYVVAEYSENEETAKRSGDLGWVARGDYIDGIPYYIKFSNTVAEWKEGVHPPVKIGPDWHVVEVLSRRPSRPQTLEEARPRIISLLQPQIRQRKLVEELERLRKEIPVELIGEYAPGKGVDDEALLQRALLARDPEQQLALLDMIVTDFPESKSAPMALFLKATVVLEHTGDTTLARRYLDRLLRKYPDTDLREQAEFVLEHMHQLTFKTPHSIEELRRIAK